MKKFYMILAALLIGSMCFAQKHTIKLDAPIVSNDRSAWVGNSSISSLDIISSGEEYAIAPKTLQDIATGSTVTKVKFYSDATNYTAYGITNSSYTIKIYENVTLTGDLSTYGLYDLASVGSAVYTQDVTATDGWNEITLNTPFEVTDNAFWVAIHANGTSAVFFGDADPASEGVYFKYYTASADDATSLGCNEGDQFWTIPEYCVDQECTSTEINPIALCVFVEDGQAYVESSDLEALFLNTYPNPTGYAETTMTLEATDDLTLYPAIQNNGPDAATTTISFDFTVDGNSILEAPLSYELTAENSLDNGYYMPINFSQTEGEYLPFTITAAEMDNLGISGTANVCLVVTYAGTDSDLNNNETCIAITRNVTSVEENIAEAVSVYPNPANDMFTVANAEGATIVVVNSLGQVVASIENAAANQTIDASNFANGTYFVKVNEDVVKINVVK